MEILAGVLCFDSFNILFPVKILRQIVFDSGFCHSHSCPVSRADNDMGGYRSCQEYEENCQQQPDAEKALLKYKEN